PRREAPGDRCSSRSSRSVLLFLVTLGLAVAASAPVPGLVVHLPPQKSFLRGTTTGAIKG
ncbi:hypothetical protein, partial [Lentzea sp. NPDC060358]|uniref:hypothetical protein n=1 Tax=Lentzea sp. NPDC060358 TaxID=3347103 RepID=UPI003663E567